MWFVTGGVLNPHDFYPILTFPLKGEGTVLPLPLGEGWGEGRAHYSLGVAPLTARDDSNL